MIGRHNDSAPNGILISIFCHQSYSTSSFLKHTHLTTEAHRQKSPWVSFNQTVAVFSATPQTQVWYFPLEVTAEYVGWLTHTQTHLNTDDTIWILGTDSHYLLCWTSGLPDSIACYLLLLLGQQLGFHIYLLCRETSSKVWTEDDFTILNESFSAAQMMGCSWKINHGLEISMGYSVWYGLWVSPLWGKPMIPGLPIPIGSDNTFL